MECACSLCVKIMRQGSEGANGGTATPIYKLGILFVGQFLEGPVLVVDSLADF